MSGSSTKLQKRLTLHVSNNNFKRLWNASTAAERKILDSTAIEGGVLISTVPKESRFRIPAVNMRERLCVKLGLPVDGATDGICPCLLRCMHGDRRISHPK